jgi:hypothetical protein
MPFPPNLASVAYIESEYTGHVWVTVKTMYEINNNHRKIIMSLEKGNDGFAGTSDAEYDIVNKLVAPIHN